MATNSPGLPDHSPEPSPAAAAPVIDLTPKHFHSDEPGRVRKRQVPLNRHANGLGYFLEGTGQEPLNADLLNGDRRHVRQDSAQAHGHRDGIAGSGACGHLSVYLVHTDECRRQTRISHVCGSAPNRDDGQDCRCRGSIIRPCRSGGRLVRDRAETRAVERDVLSTQRRSRARARQ